MDRVILLVAAMTILPRLSLLILLFLATTGGTWWNVRLN